MSDLLAKLKADPRHHDIRIISDQLEECRHFADWSMGLINAPDEEKPKVVRELRSLSTIENAEWAIKKDQPLSPALCIFAAQNQASLIK